MQVANGDRNSQLGKDEETHLRKRNLQLRKNGTKAKNDSQARASLRWEALSVSRRGLMQHPARRRDWGKGRGQEPGAKDLLESRTLILMMMMTLFSPPLFLCLSCFSP